MGATAYGVVEVAAEKWGGLPHYRGAMHVLGEDEHGTWLWGPAGRTIRRGSEVVFTTKQDALGLMPHEAWWFASWWLGHPAIDLYVNINTPAIRADDLMTYVDLDLDVVRLRSGACEIVDQDEFAAHQVELDYPASIVAATEAAAQAVLAQVSAGDGPFGGPTADHWAATARTLDLPIV